MTDEEIAAVFMGMYFQDYACGQLMEDMCKVIGVRVVSNHIHFDILVEKGTFSTTTTEMPWGMPWWAWFLIFSLSALLCCCCCCCLPLGACARRRKQDEEEEEDNAKDPLRGTYQSLDNEEEEEDSVMSDAEGSIAAADSV